jgi:hypothetical protein
LGARLFVFAAKSEDPKRAQRFVLSGKLEMGRREQEMKFPLSKEVGVLRA